MGAGEQAGWTLKPSLVEWKQDIWKEFEKHSESLETFLGGMETSQSVPAARLRRALKPSLVEWKPVTSPNRSREVIVP